MGGDSRHDLLGQEPAADGGGRLFQRPQGRREFLVQPEDVVPVGGLDDLAGPPLAEGEDDPLHVRRQVAGLEDAHHPVPRGLGPGRLLAGDLPEFPLARPLEPAEHGDGLILRVDEDLADPDPLRQEEILLVALVVCLDLGRLDLDVPDDEVGVFLDEQALLEPLRGRDGPGRPSSFAGHRIRGHPGEVRPFLVLIERNVPPAGRFEKDLLVDEPVEKPAEALVRQVLDVFRSRRPQVGPEIGVRELGALDLEDRTSVELGRDRVRAPRSGALVCAPAAGRGRQADRRRHDKAIRERSSGSVHLF